MKKFQKVLLANVNLEFEMRTTDYIDLSQKKGYLESSTVIIKFDKQSVLNLMMVRDLAEEAVIKV